jgi:hypothetical protein
MPRIECSRLPQTEFVRLYLMDALVIKRNELNAAKICAKVLWNPHTEGMLDRCTAEYETVLELLQALPRIKRFIDRQRRREKRLLTRPDLEE